IVTDHEIDSLLAGLKPQPSPSVRQDIDLREWKAYGYREGLDEVVEKSMEYWKNLQGAKITDGVLILTDANGQIEIDPMDWRFKLQTNLRLDSVSSIQLYLDHGRRVAI